MKIPHDWEPRPYQLPVLEYFDKGGKRAATVWHRRAGKDAACLNHTARAAFQRTASYWHLLPTQRQARKAIWHGVNPKTGTRIIDQCFPPEIRKRTLDQEMLIEFINGSTWQLAGSDSYDSLVGSNVAGVIFSEWSLSNPLSWDYIRPILAENGGWAWFNYTPRGKNHGYSTHQMARKNPKWFSETLTVEDTKAISLEIIQEERDSGMDEDKIQQEYYCSFDVAIPGAYYAREVAAARADKRIGFIPIEKHIEVHTFWDLGIADSMAIWFVQAVGGEVRLIHYYENNNLGMGHYLQYLRQFASEHGIQYGEHFAPHDIEVRELMSGKSRKDTAREMGIIFRTVPQHKIADGIEAGRKLWSRIFIDETRAEQGLNALASYHREYDERKAIYKDIPVHDWASHGADAFRTLAVGWRDRLSLPGHKRLTKSVVAQQGFDVFASPNSGNTVVAPVKVDIFG